MMATTQTLCWKRLGCASWHGEDGASLQKTRRENGSYTQFLPQVHLHSPHARQGHDDQYKVRDDVTEAVDIHHIGCLDVAVGFRIQSDFEVP